MYPKQPYTDMEKPPLAPKPKLLQPNSAGMTPAHLRKNDFPHPSPGPQKRVKPALAPKPTLPKPASTRQSSPLSLTSQTTVLANTGTTRNVGLLNSNNRVQLENKKPDWDYIIPICLCSQQNCQCIVSTAMDKGRLAETKGQKPVARAGLRPDYTTDAIKNQTIHASPQPSAPGARLSPFVRSPAGDTPKESPKHHPNKQGCGPAVATPRRPPPGRTQSDEANGNCVLLAEAGRAAPALEATSCPRGPPPLPKRPKPVSGEPLPVPRKPRKAALARQERVEEEPEERAGNGGREAHVREVTTGPAERKSHRSLSVAAPAPGLSTSVSGPTTHPCLPGQRGCAPPAPPPRKKAFLSAPAQCPLPQDVEEVELHWGDPVLEMECSVDDDDDDDDDEEKKEDGVGILESDRTDYTRLAPPESQPAPGSGDTFAAMEGGGVSRREPMQSLKDPPKKPQRHSAPTELTRTWGSTEEVEAGKPAVDQRKRDLSHSDDSLDGRATRRLPSPPASEKPGWVFPSPAAAAVALPPPKASRSSPGKQRAKSFTAVDLARSEGQKRHSFRRLLDLKLKMFPRRIAMGTQGPGDVASPGSEQSVDLERRGAGAKASPPHAALEQSVDGDEFRPEEGDEAAYENMPYYEEIPDYINVQMVGDASPGGPRPSTAWPHTEQDDDNIYEEQEPYMPLEGRRELHSSSESSFELEAAQEGDGSSDDDDIIMAQSSDEEEDEGSSSSSRDVSAPSAETENECRRKKSKIHHIAMEIKSSENVFVDVIKLLHIDFREAVSKASNQAGKPVIEERFLNQILYNLPQLYELNQDLLRELEQRVHNWDENSQLADIFVKKGPYLKMYSTYIREFDKNVALLEEQSKRNSAFGAVVREFEASPRCANLALRHYLLKPVQRIPQYQLLLTDYFKHLPPASADYKDTQAALVIVKEVAHHANDFMKQGDNFQKLIQVQCILNGHHEIVQPGRVFLKEGFLKKLSRKIMQPRMFFLFNDTLLYTTPVQSGQFKLNNMLSLAGMKVSKPMHEAHQNELNIESVERSFILSASSAAERDDWLQTISMAINDHTKKKISFISSKSTEETEENERVSGASLGSKAPIWIPDPRATMCMICTCEFTLTWRRHHCRACGKVVCQACSSNKHCLKYLKNQLARVCNQCFVVLQQRSSEKALSTTPSPDSKSAFTFSRKHKRIPAALKEVSANTDNSSMSGYLQRSKGNKKQGRRLWFVIKDKVLYTYAASENVAALESQPLLGFVLKEDSTQKLQFKLYHKNTIFYIFKADDIPAAQRWIDSFKEAMVLE
ncbi:FYVE, RhoGEF and PH domain-containing protein 6-like isoform X3 [Gadus macrocephalus]|uniref:FYVE, RhoGEF and PH domain-containing protein 6-like isoform X3 n=1 Tax=Gadus macrocephalus TaxID=80720 RepID=UPI0028CBA13E|nr:FYVE, RhoGEF and PH domain-containing protein 6-like isoform X3 [Gadus macrocephalus]